MESYRTEIQRLQQEHNVQLEAKDAFCDVEKVCMLAELQADYQSKLLALCYEQYDLDYWAGYVAEEGVLAQGDGSKTSRDAPESL